MFSYAAILAVYYLTWAVRPDFASAMNSHEFGGHPMWAAIALASILNPIWEELVWLGYAVPGPARWRLALAVLWSVVPRCLVHSYQGWAAVFVIGPLGLCYLAYYFRTGRLWPVVIAHGLQDLISLSLLTWHRDG